MNEIFGLIKKILGIGMPCAFNFMTGLYCPGCGGTRAVRALLRGNLRMSFQYHPLVLYTAVIILLELVIWITAKVFHCHHIPLNDSEGGLPDNSPPGPPRRYSVFILIGAGIVLVNWFYKNYMLVYRGVDLLPVFK